jgi:phosphoglycerate kinase
MKSLHDLPPLAGKRVLLRLDLNVPLADGKVVDDFRIVQALPTITYLQKEKARILVVAHLENETEKSLRPVAAHLNTYHSTVFADTLEEATKLLAEEGDAIVVLENIRSFPGEKANDPLFAKQLASCVDYYVNEAFSVSHRPHTSIVGVPALIPHAAGFNFVTEVTELSKALTPVHPFVFILGGAKFETKLPLVRKFLQLADTVFIGGALANDCLKAAGHEVGLSKVGDGSLNGEIAQMLSEQNFNLPLDVLVLDSDGKAREVRSDSCQATDRIMDAGSTTVEALVQKITTAKMILWNGPLGVYEKGYTKPTDTIALAISKSGAHTILGGGDTLASIKSLGVGDSFTFVSTAGGAMLDFLAEGTLPGIEALN